MAVVRGSSQGGRGEGWRVEQVRWPAPFGRSSYIVLFGAGLLVEGTVHEKAHGGNRGGSWHCQGDSSTRSSLGTGRSFPRFGRSHHRARSLLHPLQGQQTCGAKKRDGSAQTLTFPACVMYVDRLSSCVCTSWPVHGDHTTVILRLYSTSVHLGQYTVTTLGTHWAHTHTVTRALDSGSCQASS